MSIKARYRDIIGFQAALNKLDGYTAVEEVAKPEDPSQTFRMPVRRSYEFDGATRRGLARCLAEVNAAADKIAEHEASLREKHRVPDTTKESRQTLEEAANLRINQDMQSFLDSPVVLDCGRVSYRGLDLDTNPIPVSILSLIDPLLKD